MPKSNMRVVETSPENAPRVISEESTGSDDETPAYGPTLATMIAEAAYYRAEQRAFAPGLEMDDWLAAEREVMNPPPTY